MPHEWTAYRLTSGTWRIVDHNHDVVAHILPGRAPYAWRNLPCAVTYLWEHTARLLLLPDCLAPII